MSVIHSIMPSSHYTQNTKELGIGQTQPHNHATFNIELCPSDGNDSSTLDAYSSGDSIFTYPPDFPARVDGQPPSFPADLLAIRIDAVALQRSSCSLV